MLTIIPQCLGTYKGSFTPNMGVVGLGPIDWGRKRQTANIEDPQNQHGINNYETVSVILDIPVLGLPAGPTLLMWFEFFSRQSHVFFGIIVQIPHKRHVLLHLFVHLPICPWSTKQTSKQMDQGIRRHWSDHMTWFEIVSHDNYCHYCHWNITKNEGIQSWTYVERPCKCTWKRHPRSGQPLGIT